MTTLEFVKQSLAGVDVDVLAVFATKGDTTGEPCRDAVSIGETLGLDLADELAGLRFDGELGSVARIPTRGKAKAGLLLVVGLGPASDVDLRTLRKAAAAAARNATKDSRLAVVVPADVTGEETSNQTVAQAVAEGGGLGAYAYTQYRSKPHDAPAVESISILPGEGTKPNDVKRGVDAAQPLVEATSLARDLVNTPPQDKRPPALADRISEVAKAAGLKVKVLDERTLAKQGFGGLIGVGQGSDAPPRLVELTHEPRAARDHVILVGKGITFDSGGLSLKPSSGMSTMKMDMAGAATVVGAMTALKSLGVKTKVTGLIALAENMPSGTAQRVSDVLTQYGGTTVEVMNTDAEGRLVLADALAYGAEAKPDAMIDVATLTGAQIVALGKQVAALMGTDDDLLTALRDAAEGAGELIWPLPLPTEYAEQLKSPVADLKNIGKAGEAGTITAALFLKEFVGDVPWAHLDIAGPAWSDDGDAYDTAKGGTGMGVRTLVRYLHDRTG